MGTARHPPSVESAVGLVLPDDLKAHLQAELDALAKLDGAEGVAPAFLRFCEQVATAQTAARAAIRAMVAPGNGSAGARRLEPNSMVFDAALLRDLLRSLSSAEPGPAAPAEDHLRSLTDAADRDPEVLRHLAAAVLRDDDARSLHALAQRLGVPPPALLFVGRLLVAPFATEARFRRPPVPKLDARTLDDAEAGRCPTCASAPALAVLSRDDGGRRLLCGLCGETWLAPRLMCVACGTRDQSRLGVLYVRESDARWIETCDACGRYLKTIDERRLPEDYVLVLRAEDAATLYLDLLAEDAGHVRPDYLPFSFHEITP